VAVNVINSSAWLHAVAALEKHGVDRTKVRFTEVPFPQMNDPLLNGQLDAVVQVEPFRSKLMATDKAEIVSWTYVETAPNSDITQYIALAPWVEKNRATAEKFARAVIKGGAVRQCQRGRHPRHQSAVHRPQSRAEGQSAAAAARGRR
jgi:NitT/TauT family transport system substrate-binding protein